MNGDKYEYLEDLPSLDLRNRSDGGKGPLGRGSDRKELVLLLQTMLKMLGYDLGSSGPEKDGIDGIFGELTEKAVKQFQENHKDWEGNQLKSDGLAGPRTSDALNRATVGKQYHHQKWPESYQTPLELTENFALLTTTFEALKDGVSIEITGKNKARVVLITPPPKPKPPKEKPPPKKPPPKKRNEFECDLKFLTQNCMLLPEIPEALGYAKYVDERVPCIIDLIKDYDIIGLQEIFDDKCQNKLVNGWYKKILQKNPDWIDLEQDILPQKKSLSELSDRGVIDARPNERDAQLVCDKHFLMGPDEEDIDQDGGLVIFSRHPIIKSSAFVYEDTSGIFSADYWANKGAIYACVDLTPEDMNSERGSEFYIHVFNTHLQAGGDNSEIRDKQFKELREFIEKCTGRDGYPIILLGDLNVVGGSEEYMNIVNGFKGLKLEDVWKKLKSNQSGFTWIGKDQETNAESPWGRLGNVLAVDDGKPERLDYYFYYPGEKSIKLEIESIEIVPSGPTTTYCFDNEDRCHTIEPDDECNGLKSHTVSDHLGLEAKFHVVSAEPETPETDNQKT